MKKSTQRKSLSSPNSKRGSLRKVGERKAFIKKHRKGRFASMALAVEVKPPGRHRGGETPNGGQEREWKSRPKGDFSTAPWTEKTPPSLRGSTGPKFQKERTFLGGKRQIVCAVPAR